MTRNMADDDNDVDDVSKGNDTYPEPKLFNSCLIGNVPSLTCTAETMLVASICLLLLQELLQIYALGPRRYSVLLI